MDNFFGQAYPEDRRIRTDMTAFCGEPARDSHCVRKEDDLSQVKDAIGFKPLFPPGKRALPGRFPGCKFHLRSGRHLHRIPGQAGLALVGGYRFLKCDRRWQY